MRKSTFTPLYEAFRKRVVELRKRAGLSQRDLAKRLGREHSFVSRIELAERRLDVVEFFWICRACEANPADVTVELMREFGRIEGRPTPFSHPRTRAAVRPPLYEPGTPRRRKRR